MEFLHREHIAYSICSKSSSHGGKQKMFRLHWICSALKSRSWLLLSVKHTPLINGPRLWTRNSVRIGLFITNWSCVVYSVLCCMWLYRMCVIVCQVVFWCVQLAEISWFGCLWLDTWISNGISEKYSNCHWSQILVKLQKLQHTVVRGSFRSSCCFFVGPEMPNLKICGYFQYKDVSNVTRYTFVFSCQVV